MNHGIYASPLGPIHLFSDNNCLTGLYLQAHIPRSTAYAAHHSEDPIHRETSQWLDSYFLGKNPSSVNIPLMPSGTPFQKKVWQILLQIPYGQTVTYSQIAKQFSETMSAQAIGQAVGKNPISIIIPCHRVLGSNYRLTGYAGGIEAKVWLLKHEGLDAKTFIYPKKYRGK